MIQETSEKIDVIASFVQGKLNIIRFRWKGTVLSVDKITGRWMERRGQYPVYHFSVTANKDDYYELSFDSRTLAWRIKSAG